LILLRSIPFETLKDKDERLNVSMQKWISFAKNLITLDFMCELVNNEFTAKHLECMSRIKNLHICWI
jgi:hypothetical protein